MCFTREIKVYLENIYTVKPAYNEHSSVAAKSAHSKQVLIYNRCAYMKNQEQCKLKITQYR